MGRIVEERSVFGTVVVAKTGFLLCLCGFLLLCHCEIFKHIRDDLRTSGEVVSWKRIALP